MSDAVTTKPMPHERREEIRAAEKAAHPPGTLMAIFNWSDFTPERNRFHCWAGDYVRELLGEVDRLGVVTGASDPWPLRDVLARLVDAAEHLHHDCDRHGYEEDREAMRRAREIVALLDEGV